MIWSDSNQNLFLLGSCRDGGKHVFLHYLVVMDRENELNLHAALAIGYAATLPILDQPFLLYSSNQGSA